MWAALLPLVAGAALGYMKQREARKDEEADRILAGQTQALSPWTGLRAGPVKRAPSMVGSVFEGGLQGMSMGQNLQNAQYNEGLKAAELENLQLKNNYLRSQTPKSDDLGGMDEVASGGGGGGGRPSTMVSAWDRLPAGNFSESPTHPGDDIQYYNRGYTQDPFYRSPSRRRY